MPRPRRYTRADSGNAPSSSMKRAVVSAWYQSWTKPSRASAMAGRSTSASSMVPKRSRASVNPATEPGTATARGPTTLASSATRGHAKSSDTPPPATRYMPSYAAAGATALKSTVRVSSSLARWTSMVPAPPMVLMKGSTTVIANAVATAASMALPPRARIAAPTSAPIGCSATTRPRGASGVFLVTTSSERIIFPSFVRSARLILRDVHETDAGEVEPPSHRVDPGFGRLRLDVGPILAGELLDLAHVGRGPLRGAEQDHDLFLGHADLGLTHGPERQHPGRVGVLLILGEIAADREIQLALPVQALLERGLASVGQRHPVDPQLLGLGPLGRPLLEDGTIRRARGHRQHDREHHPDPPHADR